MLSEAQHRAIHCLAHGGTNREAGRLSGVSHPTIAKWLKDDEFCNQLDEITETIRQAHVTVAHTYRDAMLQATQYSFECVEILMSFARNETLRPADRIRACEVLLSKPERLSDLLAGHKRLPENAVQFLDADGNSLDDLERSIEARILTLGQDD
ncbi:MAG: hypothetical protein F6K21_07820 [Symploca sp. SIO2D2]|nr:hypothetical protein [Symploca sp. SIO2D2]